MASLCRVTFTATPHDHSVRIEGLNDPDDILYAAEDVRAAPVYHWAWNFIRANRREHPVGAIDQRLGSMMSHRNRNQVMTWVTWLMRLLLNLQGEE